jgi:four helix bundle protein
MRRAAVSVATNIVEGCGRQTEAEFSRFLHIAFGSVREVGYLIDLAERVGYLSQESASGMHDLHGRTAAALAAIIRRRTIFGTSRSDAGTRYPTVP